MADQAMRPSEILARQVKHWRDRRKLSAQALADRIAEIGGSLSRVAISKIENGDRGVSLDEWLQLAHALAVPPPLLFLDLQSGSTVQVAPGVEVHPWLVWEWVTGVEGPMVTGNLATRVEEFFGSRWTVILYQRERAAANAVHNASSALRQAEFTGDENAARTARSEYATALRALAAVHDEMIEGDVAPPAKPRAWIDTIRELGLSKHPESLVIFEPDAENLQG